MRNKTTIIILLGFLFLGTIVYSQSTPKSNYSLEIQKVFPQKEKAEIITKNAKTKAEIDKLIENEKTNRKNDNWVLTVKGPNYNATPVIQNINYIVKKDGIISYVQSNAAITKLKQKTYPQTTNIIISECSVYGTIKKIDTLNYNLNFKYYETDDTLKIQENSTPKYTSEFFYSIDDMNKEINDYKEKINDNSKNRLLRAYQNNKQIFAYSNYEDYLKELEIRKKEELEKIAQRNKKLEEEKLKKQIQEENNKFFENIDLIECSKFNRLQQQVQGLMNDKSIRNIKTIKQIYVNADANKRKELNNIINNLLLKDERK